MDWERTVSCSYGAYCSANNTFCSRKSVAFREVSSRLAPRFVESDRYAPSRHRVVERGSSLRRFEVPKWVGMGSRMPPRMRRPRSACRSSILPHRHVIVCSHQAQTPSTFTTAHGTQQRTVPPRPPSRILRPWLAGCPDMLITSISAVQDGYFVLKDCRGGSILSRTAEIAVSSSRSVWEDARPSAVGDC